MKIIYTILFFADTLFLIVLANLFLKLIDTGMSGLTFALMLFAIVASIVLLAYFLLHYIKLPSSESNK
jgi:hypothetical protein